MIAWPPGLTVTVTAPLGTAHRMFSAARSIGRPTTAVTDAGMGLSLDVTVLSVHAREPRAFRRFRVMRSLSSGKRLPSVPARIRFLIARQSRRWSWALSSAATPVTCGVAIDVPEK